MNDRDQTAAISLSQGEDAPGRFLDFGEPSTDEDRTATDLGTGLTDLGFIRAALRRSAWLWCTTAVVGMLAGFGVLKALPPPYQASTTVLLGTNPSLNANDAVLDAQAVAQSRTVAGDALRKLGLRQSAASFVGDYTVTPATNQVLLITVKAPSSDAAVREANALASAFLTFQAHQLQNQERLVNSALQKRVILGQQQINSISKQISQLSAQPTSPKHAKLSGLVSQRNRAASALTSLKQATLANQASMQIEITKQIQDSQVIAPAAPSRYSTKKFLVIYVGTGLIAGLALGLFIVVIRVLVSDRLRRRDDVARVLGAPVKLSVGKVRLRRWWPGSRGLVAAQGTDIRRVAAYLGGVAHLGSTGPASTPDVATLSVVPVDEPQVAALALVSLAVSAAQRGVRVVVADLCAGSPAGHLLAITDPGVHTVSVHNAHLLVAIPDPDDVVLAGPLGHDSPEVQRSALANAVDAACAETDLLLTLAALDPSVGAEYLAGWACSAVAVVTAGRSSAARIHAVGELIRLAGIDLISGVLVGADKTDESLGATASPPVGSGLS